MILENQQKAQVSAERHKILINSILVDHWNEKLTVTVPRIKAFFSLTARKMQELAKKLVMMM